MARATAVLVALAVPSLALAQNALTVTGIGTSGSFETAGVTLTVSGDANRNARYDITVTPPGGLARPAHPLARYDATHAATTLFGLSPGTTYSVTVTASDPDGVTGGAQTAAVTTRMEVVGPPAALRDFYVATTGNDANPGTAAQPFLTIQHALVAALPGDHMHVAAGIYREEVSLSRSGTAANPIVIDGAAGAILDGADATLAAGTATWTGSAGVFSTPVTFDTAYVALDGQRLWHDEVTCPLVGTTTPHTPGDWCITGGRLYVHLPGGASPTGHAIQASVRAAGISVQNAGFIWIRGLEIRFYGADLSNFGKGIYLRTASDVVIERNVVHNCTNAIWLKVGDRNLIQDNEVYDTGISGLPWADAKTHQSEASGIFLSDGPATGTVIRRNRVHGTFDGINFCPPGSTVDTDVYDNTIDDHLDYGGVADGACTNARVHRNVFSNVFMGLSITPVISGPLFVVRNVFYRYAHFATGVGGYMGSPFRFASGSSAPPTNVFIYHSVAVADGYVTGSAADPSNHPALWFGTSVSSSGLVFRNNVFAGAGYALLQDNNALTVDLDYDLLFTTDTTRFIRWLSGGTVYRFATLAPFTGATGQEPHGVETQPTFANLANGDLHPAGSSPAIDRGVVIPGINDGFSGTAPDLGAFELVASPDGGSDAGSTQDAGSNDAGLSDGGLLDAGLLDAGFLDAGLSDAGLTDAGAADAGETDAGEPDAGGAGGAGGGAGGGSGGGTGGGSAGGLATGGGGSSATGGGSTGGASGGGGETMARGCGCGTLGAEPLALLLLMMLRRLRRRRNLDCSTATEQFRSIQ